MIILQLKKNIKLSRAETMQLKQQQTAVLIDYQQLSKPAILLHLQ